MITSASNPRIKWVRDLQAHSRARREAGAFVVEGVRLVEEALAAGIQPQWLIFTEGLSPRGQALVDRLTQDGAPVDQVSPSILKAAGDTETPQGILAVLPIRSLPLPAAPDFVLILDQMRDPGNLGTILRTAYAARVQALLLSPGSADPYSPKVVRAGMGAHFHLPVHNLKWPEIQEFLHLKGAQPPLHLYLADTQGGPRWFEADFISPLALVIGGEAQGAGEAARSLAAQRVHIPMPGRAESLNAAVAAGVLIFEVVRQRSNG